MSLQELRLITGVVHQPEWGKLYTPYLYEEKPDKYDTFYTENELVKLCN